MGVRLTECMGGNQFLNCQVSLKERSVECVRQKWSEKKAINCFFRLLKSRALRGLPADLAGLELSAVLVRPGLAALRVAG